MKRADIYVYSLFAGTLVENDEGFLFEYDKEYLKNPSAEAVSLTMPLQEQPFRDTVLFSFFDGLIPEGWLLDIVERNWKINSRDRMSLLLVCCRDCIGSVSVIAKDEHDGK